VKRATCIVVALLLLALPASASADVDPASDVLLFQNEYFPRVQPASPALKGTLTALTAEANKAGYNIKVAVIGARLDLGGVPSLYRHPDQYAKYLGLELRSATGIVNQLVVVMRSGVGLYGVGDEASAIKGLSVPPKATSDDLTRVAIEATEKLSAAAGHPLAKPSLKQAVKKGKSNGAPVIAFLAPVILLFVMGILLWQQRRRRGSSETPANAVIADPDEPAEEETK
jgi:hypothetical protein